MENKQREGKYNNAYGISDTKWQPFESENKPKKLVWGYVQN